MKVIVAVIQPAKLNAVREVLEKVEVERMTVCDAQGFGQQRGRTETSGAVGNGATLLRKIALEIVVNEDFLERTVETIVNVARTGRDGTIGDGKIFVVPCEEVFQISDSSHGPGAV